ncbi:hypothetical protein HYPSUDRAFT_201390 [Hypholoma sublateritium FD-334 SS-4]|uniref:Uncharacterized protein n=1 Tax=Hypholoma sublateritium (strain FD-334 SS-4) TaxID=945553 RepID=A0A0D2P3U4_HYPSF|nr:hypothetical protein HYPSUDRAFT_201390 [Hypholoma sublateritium FD-334 SS-4]
MSSSNRLPSEPPRPEIEPPESVLDPAMQTAVKNFITLALENRSKKQKRKSSDDAVEGDSEKSVHKLGRFYSRQDDPFSRIDTIVNFGIQHEVADDEESNTEAPPLSIRETRLLRSWKLLCSIIPNFLTEMLALSDNRPVRKAMCQEIYKGVTAARADDSSSLRGWIPAYILLDPKEALIPPIQAKARHYNDRGFHHPATASLLCPLKYPDTPETYNSIKAGKLSVTATLLPRFLFPDKTVYDPMDISKDLLSGHVMFRAAKHIFQGPSSALEEPGAHRGKQGNAALSGITSMTPYTIAYVAMQVRFCLSSTGSWAAKDGAFSYAEFYWHIVGLLDDDEDEECTDIINLYNHHVFGTANPHGDANGTDAIEVENEYDVIKSQRAGKRARRSL